MRLMCVNEDLIIIFLLALKIMTNDDLYCQFAIIAGRRRSADADC
jgi:hypothetical protein